MISAAAHPRSAQGLADRGKGDSPLKNISIDSSQTNLEGVLREAADGEVVFPTTDGLPRFALVPVDESDQEVFALRSNAEFMAYLDECARRAMIEPSKSLEEIKKLYWTEELALESSSDEEARPQEATP
jgi:antitoxin (DNA-binding transcriptional repressor) of toxin-antitoxin stability system